MRVACEVRPRLATRKDVDALWENLDVIDCFATDHAPHTVEEKNSDDPPPGFPRLGNHPSFVAYHHFQNTNSRQITGLIGKDAHQSQKDFQFARPARDMGRSGRKRSVRDQSLRAIHPLRLNSFEGWKVKGKVRRVVLRGRTAFEDGKILAPRRLWKEYSGLINILLSEISHLSGHI